MQTKRCSTCKEIKPVSEFNKNRSAKDGLQKQCKDCHRECVRRYRATNKDQCRRWSYRSTRKKNNISLELAHRHGQPWEDWENEFVLANNGLTVYQKAVKLGRSYKSVEARRVDLRKSARAELTHGKVRV